MKKCIRLLGDLRTLKQEKQNRIFEKKNSQPACFEHASEKKEWLMSDPILKQFLNAVEKKSKKEHKENMLSLSVLA